MEWNISKFRQGDVVVRGFGCPVWRTDTNWTRNKIGWVSKKCWGCLSAGGKFDLSAFNPGSAINYRARTCRWQRAPFLPAQQQFSVSRSAPNSSSWTRDLFRAEWRKDANKKRVSHFCERAMKANRCRRCTYTHATDILYKRKRMGASNIQNCS